MGAHFTPPPPAAISRVLATFDRNQLAGFIAVAIDLLDVADAPADPDEPMFAGKGTFVMKAPFGLGDDLAGDPVDAEDDDQDTCGAGDDRGSAAAPGPRVRMGFTGDAPDRDENAEHNGDHEREEGVLIPVYGVDQALGPINERSAGRDHYARELGLVRSPSGGWRHPIPSVN